MIRVRAARLADGPALRQIDTATWTAQVSPAAAPPADPPFFDGRVKPGDVLVAELDGSVVGYTQLGQSIPLPSHEHVLQLNGLAVYPACQRSGVGRSLVEAAIEEAGRRGVRKLSLRVLGSNTPARRLYEACGFVVEGELCEEFLLAGQYVDDIFMARLLPQPAGGRLVSGSET